MSTTYFPNEPEHFTLGRRMARWLRDRYGSTAEQMIPKCYEMAHESGEQLQVDTVRMAEKFLITIKEPGQ